MDLVSVTLAQFMAFLGMRILDSNTADRWKSLIIDTINNTALIEGKWANWPQNIDGQRSGRDALLVQFCHGSPGIICCLADLMGLDEDFDRLMLAGGELAWRAGPLSKGGNICHGAAGTGYSFLKLFEVTGDELWLDRARSFAAFGIQITQEQRESAGSYHYSLWNGDTGLVHFVHHCLNQTSDIPTMDYF